MIKKIIYALAVAALFFAVQPVLAAERIESFDVKAVLHSDASVDVEEIIKYDFGEEERHGIYRDITVGYKARGGSYKLRVSDISVVDENNNPYNFIESSSGNNLQIKIGDADTLITGEHIYRISYTVRRAINYFDDHEELYWNATGNGWNIPIESSTMTVVLPPGLTKEQITETCYAGIYGSTDLCEAHNVLEKDGSANAVEFSQGPMDIGGGLTVVVGVPAGTIQKPPLAQTVWEIVRDNGILLLPILVFIWLFRRWKKYGRDDRGRGTIIPEYEAPDNLAPAEVGTIFDGRADKHDVSAQIIQLAINGYLKIKREETGAVFKSDDYIFTKLKPADDLVKSFDRELMDKFFEHGDTVKISDLKYKFSSTMQKIIGGLYADLTKVGYFKKNPMMIKIKYIGMAFLIFFLTFFIGAFFGLLGAASFIATAIMVACFGFIMPALTVKGSETKEKILGLKMYLTVAEEARIKFHNAPEKNPQIFEKLLPYAMVMKVENEWAKQFEGIYNTQPSWYDDPNYHGVFNAAILTHSLSGFDTAAASTLSATVSSASSGGSGFSGGGSGGGFGGGGGGSW